MHNLGQTRSARRADHVLLTPDTFVRAPLPGMRRCTAVVHAGPALGAAFTEYTAEFEADGVLRSTQAQRFAYVLEGSVEVEAASTKAGLGPGGYAYFPEELEHRVTATRESKVIVIEKAYRRLQNSKPPELIVSVESAVQSLSLIHI